MLLICFLSLGIFASTLSAFLHIFFPTRSVHTQASTLFMPTSCPEKHFGRHFVEMEFNFEVVISGISGRFPECDDIDTFKKKLYSGNSKEFITNNEKKWAKGFKRKRYGDKIAVPDATGKYLGEYDLDFRFFMFNKLFARSTAPANRKILEPAFEAIVDAGVNPYSLDGANVGVFTTTGISERDMYFSDSFMTDVLLVLGNAKTMSANRLSYALNFTGPSYAFHCDPLGGLEALKVARDGIASGSFCAAIVAVASNVTNPKYSYNYMNLDFLSTDECCRSFDKNASGFVRSESTVALFLQRAQDAKRQYAKLEFCDVFFEGLSPHTLMGYDEKYLRNSLRRIYERNGGGALAKDLAFMELTGCALKKIEKHEANAVADVLCKQKTTPLMVGSVKSNVGHTEVAAGFMSVLKALIALDSQMIAPNANFSEVNDDIRAFRDKKMQVVDRQTELKGNVVAVNAIGIWGVVNHVLLQSNSRKPKKYSDNIPRLLLLSGRTMDGLRQVLKKIQFDSFNAESISLTNDVFHKNMPSHIYRGFTILPKIKTAPLELEECGTANRPICFIFSGMGSQWNGMGKELLDFPIIAEVIKRCDAVLKPKSIDIYYIMLSDDPTIFDDITNAFVAIICMQIALTEVLRKLNIVPDLIVGHSAGEIGCGYADGALDLEQAVLVAYARGIASTSSKTVKGMMAAVGKGYEEIKDHLPANIEVACHNAANSCTLSGPAEDIEAYVRKLKNEGVFAKSVNVANIAFHSKYVEPAGPKLLEMLKEMIPEPKKRSSKWISSSIPESEWHLPQSSMCSAEYFTNNLLKPVLFEEASKYIPKNAICIELAPHGILQAILKRSLPETCANIPLTRRSAEKENLHFLLSSIGRLFIAGAEPIVNNLYPPVEYPVSRGTPSISPYCTWFRGDSEDARPPSYPAKPFPLSRENIVVRINEEAEFNFLKYHQINERTVLPPSFYLYLVWRILSVKENVKMDELPVLFEKVQVHKNTKISISKPRLVNILIQASGAFEVLSRSKTSHKESEVILTGRVQFIREETKVSLGDIDRTVSEFSLNADEIDAILKNAGFLLGECFQLLTALKVKDSETRGKIKWTGNWVTFLDSIMKFQMFSDLNKSKLCFLQSIREMVIVPSVVNSQQLDSQILANYTQVTKCFQCSGIQITDVKWKTRDPMSTSKSYPSLRLRKMRFVPYNNPSCQSPAEFVDLCLQISLESLSVTNKTDSKCYICDCTGKFSKNLRRSEVMEDYKQEKIKFCDYKTLSARNSFQNDSCFLLAEEKIPDIVALHLDNISVLLIVSMYNSSIIPSEFVSISMQNFNEKVFILLKKCNSNENSRLSNATSEAKSEIIIQPYLDSNQKLMCSRKRISTKYTLSTDNNPLSLENETKSMSKLTTGLPKMVLRNQEWGSYRYLSSNLSYTESDLHSKLENALMDTKIESIHVEFIRPDPTALDQLSSSNSASQNRCIGVEFSGVNSNGQKLMGLASVNLDDPISKIDPLLTWPIPEEWTLAEAVSLPSIYAHVFHIPKLIERSLYGPSPTVLINAGEDMPVVEICLYMCVSKQYHVYVSVSSSHQVDKLRQNCPWFNESDIIYNGNGHFDVDVMTKTKGQGVNVIVNYSAGIKSITSSMNCVSSFAYYIETVQSNMNEKYGMGMYNFGHSLYATVLPRNISYLLNLHDDAKVELHEAVSEGIKIGLVHPIKELDSRGSSIRIDNNETTLNWRKPKTTLPNGSARIPSENYRFRRNHSYIILGGEQTEETWINLIYWLSEKGATNFVVLLQECPNKSRLPQQLHQLLTNKRIILSFEPLNALVSVERATRLIQETSKIALVDSVFFVSLESSPQKIRLMDLASKQCQQNIKFVSLFSGGLEEMELRRSKGLPAFVLHGANIPKNIPEIMNEFEKSLSTSEDCPDVLYQIIDTRKQTSFEEKLSLMKDYLPKNINCLQRIGSHLSNTHEFVEMTTKSLRFTYCRGVLPIFMIPSLHGSELTPLLHTLLYPVFCASLPENSVSIKDTAAKLFECLKRVQPVGPVTLIGETWSAAIAIELSSIIKQSGRDFRLFLLQGNPVEWKETISSLNLSNRQEFEKFLTQIYGEELAKWCSIPDQSASGNKWTVAEMMNAAHIRRCLNVMRVQFNNICDYDTNNANLENTVLFSETVPQNVTSVLSNTCDIICIKEGNYEKFIRRPEICRKINKEAIFSNNF